MRIIKFSENNRSFSFDIKEGTAQLFYNDNENFAELKINLSYSAAFGMGEKYDGLNKKGQCVINTVEEKFCHQGDKTYCTSPFFFTDTGFGLYVKTNKKTVFDFKDTITVTMPKDCDICVFCGAPQKIISEYMSLFGVAKLPPKWAFGPWISANHWNSREITEDVTGLLEKYNFPATVLVLENWSDEATFYIFNGAKYTPINGGEALAYSDFDFSESRWNDPKTMVENLHKKGLRLILWQVPVYKKQEDCETISRQNENDRKFAAQNHLCVMKTDGEPYTIPKGKWFAGSMIPDFTNPEAKKLWFKKRQYLLDIGVDGFKTDGGEFIYQDDLHFFDGSDGAEMKNRYCQSYTESYTEFIGDKRTLFSRAGFSGQHTTPIHWAGDQQSENSELKGVLSAGLSAAMSGIPFWGFDIAGFAGKLPTMDLYRRATQMACFCPVMQWHSEPDGGQFKDLLESEKGNNERSPWNIAKVNNAPEFTGEMRFWHNLRMNLLPYIYSLAVECSNKNVLMMRPLAYEFSEERQAVNIEDEFMLGDSLLVAPLLEENCILREVYLPKGDWYGFFDRAKYEGGKTVTVECEKTIPVFIRDGYAVALNLSENGKLGSSVSNSVDSYKTLWIFAAGKKGFYSFKDDLGSNFTFSWNKGIFKTSGVSKRQFKVLSIT